ncbi:MAG: c-type cytochrome [Solirubrobacterales bacterium]
MASSRNTHCRLALGAAAALAAALAVTGCTNDVGNPQNANLVNGKKLFVQKCGACHQLRRAGTKGVSGPNLDAAFAVSRQERWGDKAVAGVVYGQINYPGIGNGMPAKLVTGDNARDVAAYVSTVASKPGKDVGLLATAVPVAGPAKTAVAKNGVLSISADPNGLLAYVETKAEAPPGPINLEMPNKSGIDHNVVIEGLPVRTNIVKNGVAKGSGTLKPGTFTYFCSVPGHREAGMVGKLTVK